VTRKSWSAPLPADASGVVEIENSPIRLIRLFGVGVLMTALSVFVAIPWLPGSPLVVLLQGVGYVGTIFFGLCTIVVGWRLLMGRGPVVTIAPHGIRDTRVAADFIPWTAVRRVSTWEFSGQKVVVLSIDPAVEGRLILTSIARWSRGPNRALGIDGLCVTAHGLKIDHSALISLCQSRARAAQSGMPPGA